MTDNSQARRNLTRRKPVPLYLPSPPPRASSLRRSAQFQPLSGPSAHKQLPPLPLVIHKTAKEDCAKDPEDTQEGNAPRTRPRPVQPGQRARASIVRSSTIAAPEVMTKADQPQAVASSPSPAQRHRKARTGYPSRLHRSKTLPAPPPVQPEAETLQTPQMRQINRCPIPKSSPYGTGLHVRNPDEKANCQKDNGTSYHVLYPELPLRESWHVQQANTPVIPVTLKVVNRANTSPSDSADSFHAISVISEVPKEDDIIGRKAPASNPVGPSSPATDSWGKLKTLGRIIRQGIVRVFQMPLACGSVKY